MSWKARKVRFICYNSKCVEYCTERNRCQISWSILILFDLFREYSTLTEQACHSTRHPRAACCSELWTEQKQYWRFIRSRNRKKGGSNDFTLMFRRSFNVSRYLWTFFICLPLLAISNVIYMLKPWRGILLNQTHTWVVFTLSWSHPEPPSDV